MMDICTVPANIAGLPAISIPCGLDKNKMPIGMQIIGNSFEDYKVLNAAYQFEKAKNTSETFLLKEVEI